MFLIADDILKERMTEVKQAQFEVKALHYFLGVKFIQDHGWVNSDTTIRTPVDTSTKLVKAKDEDTFVDQAQYQSAVGSLLYLSTATRPDITYAVSGLLWSRYLKGNGSTIVWVSLMWWPGCTCSKLAIS